MPSPRTFLASLEQIGIKLGLDQIRGLIAGLDHPDRAYRSIAIAGTNGKGSVTAMLERALRAAGYRTGRFTSPHLTDLEERFAIDGVNVDPAALDDAIARVAGASAALPAPPSYFEATTAAGLDLFRSAGIDVALLEVGLGGRLDATNAVGAVASVITSVDFDHQQYLGDTIEAIAFEKAGIVKPATVCVLASNPQPVITVVAARCREVGAGLVLADTGVEATSEMRDGRAQLRLRTPVRTYAPMTVGLRGRHQIRNAIAAVRLLEEVDRRGLFQVPEGAIRIGVEDVVWPGRLELVRIDGHDVLIDGAHNAAGAEALAAFIRETYGQPVPLVLGVLSDKDIPSIVAPLTTVASRIICTAASSPRAIRPADLAAIVAAQAPHLTIDTEATPRAAIARAATAGSPVIVAGSLYLAGAIRAYIS